MVRSMMGTRIRERRRAKKLSQSALAAKAGISASYMNLIEHNHRGIAGRTLLAIAESLDIHPTELSDGANHHVFTKLQEAASFDEDNEVELHRVEEYVGRFPGWARLSTKLLDNIQLQDQRLLALSDRLGADPFFSEAMHLMLSNVTAIQSTSDILASTPDIDDEQADKFLDNMRSESTRLSETVSKLLAYFEQTSADETASQTKPTQSKLELFWEGRNFYLPELEAEDEKNSENLGRIMKSWNFHETGEEKAAKNALDRYNEIAKILPLSEFISAAETCAYNPVALAQQFNCHIHDIFYRFAHLPDEWENIELPQFGLIECDGAGGVLFRKPLKTLALPKKSGACPLWPLYRSISQPMQPLRAVMETPTGESFITHAFTDWSGGGTYGMPDTVKSAMLFTADYQSFLPAQERRILPTLKVGLNCEVCPRANCSARRADSILNT